MVACDDHLMFKILLHQPLVEMSDLIFSSNLSHVACMDQNVTLGQLRHSLSHIMSVTNADKAQGTFRLYSLIWLFQHRGDIKLLL